MKILCVIPSRMGSTRLPRKAMLPIKGKPMVQWVYENAARCSTVTKVVVATDHADIAQVIRSCGGNVEMTDPSLPTGSDRVGVIAAKHPDMDVVINLQGDEPFIKPDMLTTLVQPFLDGEKPEMTTLAYPLAPEKHTQPDAVKVITDLNHNAIYFSRAPIPFYRTERQAPVLHHMGLYAFRSDFLQQYRTLPQTPLELTESLEQLRVIEHGFRIRVCFTPHRTLEINTREEYEVALRYAENNT